MTDRPYTDDDLRAEAAAQYATLLTDPDYMGVGERMEGSEIESLLPPEEADGAEGMHWDDLSREDFDAAQRSIDDLLTSAADVSEWAINLGADGLEPLPEQLSAQTDNGPYFRLHFAVRPDMSDDMRRALVEGVAVEIAKHFPTD
ncbi:hypothetical protein [Streptomyces scabiei]|uniref:hypothetical protein n=1 Tax=Streptomyces scabiei TaxID=1930 RepID=UPI000765A6DA|nr:hypothetical protein [Streptomyces scabiei]